MPSKRNGKKRMRKPRAKRTNRPRYSIATSNKPFPLVRHAKLKYFDELTLNSTGNVAYTSYGANCLFDTYLGTGGHQPMGFDQLMTIYNHYEVFGAKIIVKFLPNGDQFYCGVAIDDDTTYTGAVTTALEQRGTKGNYVGVNATRPTTVVQYYSQRKMFGKHARGTDNQKGTVAVNPYEQGVFHVWQAGVAGADPAACVIQVEMQFYAMFSELKTLAAS